jgi:outer membrane assembly lipoprotein YfiO
MRLLSYFNFIVRTDRQGTCDRSICFLGLVVTVLLQTGCWGSSGSDVEPEPEAKELKTDKDPSSTDTPETELIKLSKKLYQVGMYTVARDSLASLKDRYPMGAYANFAELKHADSYFFNREYNEAAKAYENILKNSPGSPDLPYVKLQAARAHIASARDAGRDRQPWERGLVIYDELVSGYPGSSYSDIARTERAQVVHELTAYDREIIEFYRREGNQAAVDARERQFAERWGARPKSLTAPPSADTSEPVAPIEQPEVAELKEPEAFSTPALNSNETVSIAASSEPPSEDAPQASNSATEGSIEIISVQCQTEGERIAIIELARIPDSLMTTSEPMLLSPQGGLVQIDNLKLTATQTGWDCFGMQDITLTRAGSLLIKTERSLIIAPFPSPPRLLIRIEN